MGKCDADDGLPVVAEIDGLVQLVGVLSWTTGNCRSDLAGYVAQIQPAMVSPFISKIVLRRIDKAICMPFSRDASVNQALHIIKLCHTTKQFLDYQ